MKNIFGVFKWPTGSPVPRTLTPDEVERASDLAFENYNQDLLTLHVLAFAIREAGFRATKAETQRARELHEASLKAAALLTAHGIDRLKIAEVELQSENAARAVRGEPPVVRDLAAEYAATRTSARNGVEQAGEAAAALYVELIDKALPMVERFVADFIAKERALHAELGLPFKPSGIALALHGATTKLQGFASKLRAAPRRGMNVSSTFALFGMWPLPSLPAPAPKPVPPAPESTARSVMITPEEFARRNREALAEKEKRKAAMAAAGELKLGKNP